MEPFEKFLLTVFAVIVTPLVIFFVALTFVYLPVGFYTDAECLRQGYPKSHVTIGLERYCSNLDGTVTIRVYKQSGK